MKQIRQEILDTFKQIGYALTDIKEGMDKLKAQLDKLFNELSKGGGNGFGERKEMF